jgi:hypothetical protein
MKPLVYYCRWQRASLRLRGRDKTAVWGQLVQKTPEGKEKTSDFRYILDNAQLIIFQSGEWQSYFLDEKGVPLLGEE